MVRARLGGSVFGPTSILSLPRYKGVQKIHYLYYVEKNTPACTNAVAAINQATATLLDGCLDQS